MQSRHRTVGRRVLESCAFAVAIFATLACSTEVGRDNPFDPASNNPARGAVSGVIELDGLGVHGGTRVSLLDGPATVEDRFTGDDGAFLFSDVPPGRYVLTASQPGYTTLSLPLDVPIGRTLTLAPRVLQASDAMATIHGQVARPDADDHGGIVVRAVATPFSGITGTDGNFVLAVGPGTHQLEIHHPDYRLLVVPDVNVAAGQQIVLTEILVLETNPGLITGEVHLRSCAADPAEEVEAPGDDVLVTAVGTSHTAVSGTDGAFTVDGLQAGTYTLRASRAGHLTREVAGIAVRAGEARTLAEPLVLPAAKGQLAGRIRLAGASDHSGTFVQVTGTAFAAVTDTEGRFLIQGLCAGTGYEIRAAPTQPGWLPGSIAGVQVDAGETTTVADLVLARQQGGLVLNGGEPFTSSLEVGYVLAAPEATTEMRIGEDAALFEDPERDEEGWIPYAREGTYALSSSEGTKEVYAQVRSPTVLSEVLKGTVILDRTAPADPALGIGDGSGYSNAGSGAVLLTLTASESPGPGVDVVSGLASVKLVNLDVQACEAESGPCAPTESAWQTATALAYNQVIQHPLLRPDVDEEKEVWVRFSDRAGNWSEPASARVVLDREAPAETSIEIVGSAPGFTNNTQVLLQLSATDANPGIRMRLANESAFLGSSWEAFVPERVWTLLPGDGSKTVWVEFMDAAGNRSQALSSTIVLDTEPPVGTALSVAEGYYVGSRSVTVNLAAQGATEMMISTRPDFAGASWEAYTTAFGFTLPDADGEHTLWARFRDAARNVSSSLSTRVWLDRAAPAAPRLTVEEGTTVASSTVTLQIQAVASGPLDAYEMRVDVAGTQGSFEPYAPSRAVVLPGGAGVKSIVVRVRDAAGNVSGPSAIDVVYDPDPPSVDAFLINGGATWTRQTGVTLSLEASDAPPGEVVAMAISSDPAFAGAQWVAYATPVSWTLDSANGTRTLYTKVRDAAGNESGVVSASIQLDTEAPQILEIDGPSHTATRSYPVSITVWDNLSVGNDLNLLLTTSPPNCATALPNHSLDECAAVPCTVERQVTLPVSAGTHRIYACLRDAAGNATPTPAALTVTYDPDPPPQVPGITASVNSRQALVSWGAVTDAGSGVSHYELQHARAPDFSDAPATMSVAGTSALVSGLENRVAYYFRVRAVDHAGNAGAWSDPIRSVIGVRTAVLAELDGRHAAKPVTLSAGDRLYVAVPDGSGTAATGIRVFSCPIATADCRSPGAWADVLLELPPGRVVTSPHLSAATAGDRVWLGTIEGTILGQHQPVLWSCDLDDGCDGSSGWIRTPVAVSAGTDIGPYHVSISPNDNRMHVVFQRLQSGEYRTRLAICAQSYDCTIGLGQAGYEWQLTPYPNDHLTADATETGSLVVNARRGNRNANMYQPAPTGEVLFTRCQSTWICDSGVAAIVLPGTDAPGQVFGRVHATESIGFKYATFNRSGADPSDDAQMIARCREQNGCTNVGNWTTRLLLDDSEVQAGMTMRLEYGDRALHGAWWHRDDRAIFYGRCNDPDGRDCTLRANWTLTRLRDQVFLPTIPSVTVADGNVFLAWLDDFGRVTIALPSVMTPTHHAAGPAAQGLWSVWRAAPHLWGYQHLVRAPGEQTWTQVFDLDGGLTDSSFVGAAVGVDRIVSLRGYDAQGALGDEATPFTVRALRHGTTGALAAPGPCADGGASDADCAVFAATFDGSTHAVAYALAADPRQAWVAHCAPGSADCTQSESWTHARLFTAATSLVTARITTVAGEELFAGFVTETGQARVGWCSLSSGCSANGHWSGFTVAAGGASPGWDIAIVYNAHTSQQRYWVATRDGTNHIRAHSCARATDCTTAGNWTLNIQVSEVAGDRGHDMVSAGGGMALVQARAGAIGYFWCQAPEHASLGCLTGGFRRATILSGVTPLPNRTRLVLRSNRPVIVSAWDGRVQVMLCGAGSNNCNQRQLWGRSSFDVLRPEQGIDVQAAASGARIYIAFSQLHRVNVATCASDCGDRSAWRVSRIHADPDLHVSAGGGSFFWHGPSVPLGHAYAARTPSGDLEIRVGWDGALEPME
jgi:hypothetical protein